MTDSSLSEAAPAAESAAAQPASAGTEIAQSAPESASLTDDKGDKGPTSVLDAVMRGIATDKAKPEGSPASESPEKTDPSAEEVPLPDDPSADEMNRYHSQTRKRVKQVLGQRDEARAEAAKLKPRAEQADRINGFVQSSGLSWDEVNSGFELMRLMKTEPFKAREQLAPIMQALDKLCGFELPPELQQKVAQGFVDEDTARDLAQSKARAHLAQHAQTRTVQTVQKQREQAELRQFSTSVQSAIKSFENSWRGSDPDYAALAPRVHKEVELILSRMAQQGKTLSSPAEAVQIIETAKKTVKDELKPFLSRREAIAPLPGGGVQANSNPKPKSMAEAIANSLRA